MLKKIGLGLVSVLAVVIGALLYINARLDHFILAAIEKNGSAATGTAVTVGSVDISLIPGRAVITNLVVGNPPGFSTPYALALGTITLQADLASLLGSGLAGGGPIIIDRISIDQPHIFYEVSGGADGISLKSLNFGAGSNLGVLQKNAETNAKPTAAGQERKEIINDLYVTNGMISVSASLLKGRQLTEKLPVIHLSGLGAASGGDTHSQVVDQVISAITRQSALAGAPSLVRALGSAATETLGNKLKSLF
jgi:hypothetical protein